MQLLTFVDTPYCWIIAGICALIGTIIALLNIKGHIKSYTQPSQQLYIIRILFIIPLYSINSFLSLIFFKESLYFEIIRDIYESFVIYCFLILILEYVGGESNAYTLLSMKPRIKHPCPLCCLPKIRLNVGFLRFCKRSCIQFIIIKPLMGIISLTLLSINKRKLYSNDGYYYFQLIIYNISYTIALYGLYLFYVSLKDDIRAYSPVSKFLAVKIVIFATYWQGLLVNFIPNMTLELAFRWNDFILTLEMIIFSIIHYKSFGYWEYKVNINKEDINSDTSISQILSFKDVLRDVYHNIMPTYHTYVLQNEQNGKIINYKTKTYMFGNLDDPTKHNKYFIPKHIFNKYKNNNKNKRKISIDSISNLDIKNTNDNIINKLDSGSDIGSDSDNILNNSFTNNNSMNDSPQLQQIQLNENIKININENSNNNLSNESEYDLDENENTENIRLTNTNNNSNNSIKSSKNDKSPKTENNVKKTKNKKKIKNGFFNKLKNKKIKKSPKDYLSIKEINDEKRGLTMESESDSENIEQLNEDNLNNTIAINGENKPNEINV